MKSKTTLLWFVLAASLFAFAWVVQNYLSPPAAGPARVLPNLVPAQVDEVQVVPDGALAISAFATNGGWELLPVGRGTAASARVNTLLQTLATLAPATRLSGSEWRNHPNGMAEFGFANPQYTLTLTAGNQQWRLLVGNRTAPGDQVYLQLVGQDGISVADASWLSLLPRTIDAWRDDALLPLTANFDHLLITNNSKVIELQRQGPSWQLLQPLRARADSDRLAAALQQLHTARSLRFVTDDPHADLTTYGLQPATLDVWLGEGTNFLTALHLGKPVPDHPEEVYARREGLATVVTINPDSFAAWTAPLNEFRDPHLLPRLARPVNEISFSGPQSDDNFTLRRTGSNDWSVVGEKFAASSEAVQQLLKSLDGLRIAEFVKATATPTDLKEFGLNPPVRSITLLGSTADTNDVLARLDFGATGTNRVYARCAGEPAIAALDRGTPDLLLQETGWQFRDRHLWHFAETNLTSIILQQGGRTRRLLHLGEGKWLPTMDSAVSTNFDMSAVDAAALYFSDFTIPAWVGHEVADPQKDYGVAPDNLQITLVLKSGEKHTIRFGTEFTQNNIRTALAAVDLDDGTWVCLFPPMLFQYVLAGLLVPPPPR